MPHVTVSLLDLRDSLYWDAMENGYSYFEESDRTFKSLEMVHTLQAIGLLLPSMQEN